MNLIERRAQLAVFDVVSAHLQDLERLASASVRVSNQVADGFLKNELMNVRINADAVLDRRFKKTPSLFLENGWTLADIAERRAALVEVIKVAYDSLPERAKTPELQKMRASLLRPVTWS